MNIMEFIKELLLGLSIAVLVPAVSYWGIYAVYVDSVDKQISQLQQQNNSEVDKPQNEVMNLMDQKTNVRFFAYTLIGVLAIILGLFMTIQSLSIGLIGGGIINLLLGISNSLSSPMQMFICLGILLAFLIGIIFFKKS